MPKVVVFDNGWGGELFANFLQDELPAEIERVIDWRHFPYFGREQTEVRDLVEQSLAKWIGKVDLIIIANPVATSHLDYLRHQYPNQCFLGMPKLCEEIYYNEKDQVLALGAMDGVMDNIADEYSQEGVINGCRKLACLDWIRQIEDGDISGINIFDKIDGNNPPSIVTLESLHLLEIADNLAETLGWRTQVVDPRDLMLHRTCLALKIRGGSGKRLPLIFRRKREK